MGAVADGVRIVGLGQVEKIELPGGSWSRMVLNDASCPGAGASLGYSVFTPGTETGMVSHEVEELAFVVQGQGELRLTDRAQQYQAGQALHIPAHTWHAVANTGDQDLIMVFTFPFPDYPPTERR